ncbi:feruloyl-CoA synthase [Ponticaulis sp.]|uniref:feruloyl-CoA synthase n=1 Tax=Ponticaulis sp. TaxID=2020902 RepID=UPI000B6D17A4|nr:feruloyl-CoA synthase [Ponticaulis sp.]MAI92052.1 feruloyl-CoA synthase [Ponticaulis sp.]OUX96231.1 MAG: feruloyl-CoA synthase [Hyphomonadaceae bacterium TMED5]|tara:strand:+ start:18476 stop:20344 length:1869 start_codon:yes stop_codon:yes gene_type:complete
MSVNIADLPFREIPYLPQKLNVTQRENGSILLENGQPLRPWHPHMLAPIVYWAASDPERLWLAQRDPVDSNKPGWQEITYGEGLRRIRALAQGLLSQGAGPDKPVMILSRNSIEHALIMYAAMWAGSPVVPVTPAYALLSQDFARLNYADKLTEPGFIYVDDGQEYQRGIDGMNMKGRLVIYARNAPDYENAISLEGLEETPTNAVDLAYDRLSPDAVAKYMLTSGSTGEPKAVINTHGNISSMVKMIRSVWNVERLDELSGGQQVMVNFLPWSHTYGANAILHSMTDWGGVLYIDWGAPTPARLPEMIRNLKEVSPTQHTTVPAAWTAIATEIENDAALAKTFFERLLVMAYGGAAMGQDIYERIQKVAVETTGQRISLSAGYGATETSPTTSNVHWPSSVMGLIGLPLPGCTFKMAPVGEKYECRVKGPHITQGYFRNPEKTRDAFDEEGFYKLGDAVRFVDPEDPNKGLAFDGRIAEEFKLANGTWVSAGAVRVGAVSEVDGVLSDAVVCGLNQNKIGILGFLNPNFCKRLSGDISLEDMATHPEIRSAVENGLRFYNQKNPNASSRIAACILQPDMPSADAGEITEKGYLNQGKVQTLRADDVARLFADKYDDDVIVL